MIVSVILMIFKIRISFFGQVCTHMIDLTPVFHCSQSKPQFKNYFQEDRANYGLIQWFPNFFTPKVTQIRPLSLCPRVPHLIRILLLDVLWNKMYETHDHNSQKFCHCVTYRWNYSQNKEFPFLHGTTAPHFQNPRRKYIIPVSM